jgi:aldehyde dehydrogenase (NAD+)
VAAKAVKRQRKWIAERPDRYGQFVGGRWQAAGDASATETVLPEPAIGQPLWTLRSAAPADALIAVESGVRGAGTWRDLGPVWRAATLRAIATALESAAADIAVLDAIGAGRPVRDGKRRVAPLAARHFAYSAIRAESHEPESPQPLGVVVLVDMTRGDFARTAAIVSRALAVGNAVVLATASAAALGTLKLAEVCHDAGLPPGTVNVLAGDLPALIAAATSPGVGGVVVRGAGPAVAEIRRAIAGRELLLAADSGSRSVVIACDDADLDSAAAGAIEEMGRFVDAPRIGPTRLLAHEAVAAELLEQLRWRLDLLRVRDPLDATCDVGPVRTAAHVKAMDALADAATADGIDVYVSGAPLPESGWFSAPMLISDAPEASPAGRSSTIAVAAGPAIVATTFRSPDEAVTLANHSEWGAEVGLWTESATTALASSRDLAASCVCVNGVAPAEPELSATPTWSSGFGDTTGRSGFFTFGRPGAQRGAVSLAGPTPTRATDRQAARGTMSGGAPPGTTTARGTSGALHTPSSRSRTSDAAGGGPGGGDTDLGAATRWETDAAVALAAGASDWSARAPIARSRVLRRAAAIAPDVYGELPSSGTVRLLQAYADWAGRADGLVGMGRAGGALASSRAPLGVLGVALVAPTGTAARDSAWGRGPAEMVCAAIAAGNRVVVACGPRDRERVDALRRALTEAGAPVGTLSPAMGDPGVAAATLAGHLGVEALWLAGGSPAAAELEELCIESSKRLFVRDEAVWSDGYEQVDLQLLRVATHEKSVWIALGPTAR